MEVPETAYKKGRFFKFYKSHMFTDCCFLVDGVELKLHRFILACSSQVFERMLYGELNSDIIKISDISLEDFQEVLDFIYLDRFEVTSIPHAWNLFVIANRFFIEDLMANCLLYIKKNLGIKDVLMSYEFSELYHLTDLKEKCYSEMTNYFQATFLTNYHMKATTFAAVMGKFKPRVDLYDLAIKIVDWAMTECELRDIPLKSDNVLGILKEVDASKCLGPEWLNVKICSECEREIKICRCYDAVMHQTLMGLFDIVEKPDKIETLLRKKMYWLNCPEKCQSMTELKIATRIDLTHGEEFVSRFEADSRVAVLGLVIVAPMMPEKLDSNFFNGTVVVRICQQFRNVDLCKPSIYRDVIFYNCCIYLPFRDFLILEPKKVYDFRISYRTPDKSKVSVPAYYFSSHLINDNMNVTFYDEFGSIVRGMAFCRA